MEAGVCTGRTISTLGIMNAFNFMDGVNGMLGLFSLVALATLWYINAYMMPFIDPAMLYTTGLALTVFGFFNFIRHAVCFAGDVGPIAVAFILIFLLARLSIVSGNPFYLWIPTVFGIDTGLTILQRIWSREYIVLPHRRHLYQLLVNVKGLPHLAVAAGYSLLQFGVIGIMLYAISHFSLTHTTLMAAGLLVLLMCFYVVIKWLIIQSLTQ